MRDRFAGSLSLVVPPLLLTLMATVAWGETWTDTTGKFSIEATFVKVEGRSVVLRKADGSSVTVPIDRLSDASRATAKRLYEAQRAGVPVPRPGQPNGQADLLGANYPINGTLEQAAVYLSDEMRKGNFGALYLLIPKNLREAGDKQDVQQELAVTIDNYDRAAKTIESVLDQLIKLFATKKRFILNSALTQTMTPDGRAHFVKNYDSFVGFLKACRDVVADRKSLASQTLSVFLQQHANQIGSHVKMFLFNLPESIPEAIMLDNGKITQNGNKGHIEFEQLGDGDNFLLVDGYWIPEAMAIFDQEMGGDHSAMLAALRAFNRLPVDPKVFLATGMIDGMITGLMQPMLDAKNQTQFDEAVLRATMTIKTLAEIGNRQPN